jgi:hypothetical protein
MPQTVPFTRVLDLGSDKIERHIRTRKTTVPFRQVSDYPAGHNATQVGIGKQSVLIGPVGPAKT